MVHHRTCPTCGRVYTVEEKKSTSKIIGNHSDQDVINEAAEFIKPLEGFVSTPYWDYRQWSWGYGTSAGTDKNKKPSGSITKDQAHEALIQQLEARLKKITKGLQKPVSKGLMISLLSFDYNLGYGNTENIIERINSGQSLAKIAAAFKLYVYAGGSVNQNLVSRRNTEVSNFI